MDDRAAPPSSGHRVFAALWLGQFVSFFGSNLTSFAIGVWIYRTTGSATSYALISFATLVPSILVSPLAGVLADRLDRRRLMILGAVGDALTRVVLAWWIWKGDLSSWHIYAAMAAGSFFYALQVPAFGASVPLLVAKRHLGRANGLVQMGTAATLVLAPLLGGVLLEVVPLLTLVLVDIASFAFAIGMLLLVRIPGPAATGEAEGKPSLLREAAYGWRYLRGRPALLTLLALSAFLSFSLGMVQVSMTPLVLSFASPAELGIVMASASAGMLVGSLVMSAWGGPERRMRFIRDAVVLMGIILMVGVWRPSVPLLSMAAFVFLFLMPLVSGSTRVIWQSKVAPEVQGRVLAMARMAAISCLPVASLITGPLLDHVFEPRLAEGGGLAGSLGSLIGTGPGRGVALLIALVGLLILSGVALIFHFLRLERLEDELPDAIPEVT